MDAILNNPYRILGLPTTASDKEIAKRVSDLLIYAEMGKKVSYESDLPFLGELDRNIEAIKLAVKKIELPDNKIFYSLLWIDIKDSFDRKSIEFLKQGDFKSAFQVLSKEIENNTSVAYRSYSGENPDYLLKKIDLNDNGIYSIQKATPRPSATMAESIFEMNDKVFSIKQNEGFVDISETNCKINFKDKYQISCQFRWEFHSRYDEESFGIAFTNSSYTKNIVCISHWGILRFFNSNNLIIEKELDRAFFNDKDLNFLSVQRYDNFIDVILNNKSVLKIETNELFQSSTLCFSGQQRVVVRSLFISGLERKGLGEGVEINENAFFYAKNYSILYLIKTLRTQKLDGSFLNYFETIGALLKEEYFANYTKSIISKNFNCNFSILHDKFVEEFYSSLYHLVDPNEEHSQVLFHNSFARLSEEAEKKIKNLCMGSKPYLFENFIKEISSKRSKEPNRAHDYACELKNEATHFYNWYSEFYGFGSLVSKSISDKIGGELTECAIAYFNASTPHTIEHAKVALKVLTWASDFAFNQALRDRINKSISILLSTYPNNEYTIVDFVLKDRTRSTRRIIPKPANAKSNNAPKQETINSNIPKQVPINSKQEEQSKRNKTKTNINQTIYKPLKKSNVGKQIIQKLSKIVPIYFWYILFAIIILFVVLFPDNKQPLSSNNKINDNSQPIKSNVENDSPVKNNVENNLPIKSRSNLNIDLSNYKPKDQQAEVVEESKWQGNKLQNGDSPYDEYFGKGLYNYNSKCYLIFKNGNSTDAIVCLENTANGSTIRNEYIQAGTDYKMTNIPEGIYKVKTFSGNDWNPEKTMNHGEINGVFDTDLSFSISDKSSDLIQMSITETGEGISYSTGEITLYTVSNGNMQQRNINSDEFFK